MNPAELLTMRCRLCGGVPEMRQSEHLFFKLSAFQDRLEEWVQRQTHWRPNVMNLTLRYLKEGLRDRAISRDIQWGVPLPVAGYEAKRIYVWFEAVMGYLSASQEWAQHQGQPEAWRQFWQGEARAYYFLGKDNIPFHTIIWPAMLIGCGGLNLPYDVPANEFLTMEAGKLSKSRNNAVWVPDYLERFQPDPLRYYLCATMPETGDADFSWEAFQHRNNDELVATYGNLVHRVLTFTYRNFDGQVTQPGSLEQEDARLLDQAASAVVEVGRSLEACHFREGLRLAMALAQEANRYLEATAPWRTLQRDRQRCATTLWTALQVIATLRLLTAPFLPFSAQQLHRALGYAGRVEQIPWAFSPLPAGQRLESPQPLFIKLEDDLIQREVEKVGA